MYPNIDDVKRILPQMQKLEKPSPAMVWKEVVYAHDFLKECHKHCYADGRHKMIPVFELKIYAKNFIGPVSDDAFLIAILLFGLTYRPQELEQETKISAIEVVFPPHRGFDEMFGEPWNKHFAELNQEIKQHRAVELEKYTQRRIKTLRAEGQSDSEIVEQLEGSCERTRVIRLLEAEKQIVNQ